MIYDRMSWDCAITSGAAADETVVTFTPQQSVGKSVRYILTVPNYTNDVTTTVRVVDSDGDTVYQGAAHSRNATYSVPIDVNIFPGDTVHLITSGDIGNGEHDCTLKLHMER